MKYKKGDRVRIKTWDEMISEFEIDSGNNITIREGDYGWSIHQDRNLPQDRILIITDIDREGDWQFEYEGLSDWMFKEFIKSYANEYYLQQIKDEL